MADSEPIEVEERPFEVVSSLTVLPHAWRVAATAVLGVLALGVGLSTATIGRDPGPPPTETELQEQFCDVRWFACEYGRVGVFGVEEYVRWRDDQLFAHDDRVIAAEQARAHRVSQGLVRLALAAVLALATRAIWRRSRPVVVRRSAAGLQLGPVRVAPGELASIEVVSASRVRVRTHAGRRWTSVPLWVAPSELATLVEGLRAEVVAPRDPEEIARDEQRRQAAAALAAHARG